MVLKYAALLLSFIAVCVQTDDIIECTVSVSYSLEMDTRRGCSQGGAIFYCDFPYECCDNACCLQSDYGFLYSDAEIAGLVLASSALLLLLVLSVLIFCGTYCNADKDESFLFRKVGIH